MGQSEFRIILAAILIGFVAHRGFYTRKVQHAVETVREQPMLGITSRLANLLALPAFAATLCYVFKPAWIAWSALPLPHGYRWLGVTIALAGFALLQWSQQSLGQHWSDAPKLLEGQALVTHGPYRWIRHPIYAAFLMILGSLLLISANWFVGGMWIAMTGLDVAARMKAEEALLPDQFGEQYRAYLRRTGRLFPRLLRRGGRDA